MNQALALLTHPEGRHGDGPQLFQTLKTLSADVAIGIISRSSWGTSSAVLYKLLTASRFNHLLVSFVFTYTSIEYETIHG